MIWWLYTKPFVHADGALEFGFPPNGTLCLAPLSMITKAGLPVVQGITSSHHKASGNMVSGEVICYGPEAQKSLPLVANIEPRIVFETWLFHQFYSDADLIATAAYCRSRGGAAV